MSLQSLFLFCWAHSPLSWVVWFSLRLLASSDGGATERRNREVRMPWWSDEHLPWRNGMSANGLANLICGVRPEEAQWAKRCLLSLLFPSPHPLLYTIICGVTRERCPPQVFPENDLHSWRFSVTFIDKGFVFTFSSHSNLIFVCWRRQVGVTTDFFAML